MADEQRKMCPILTAGLVAKQGIPEDKWTSLLCRGDDCQCWKLCSGEEAEDDDE